MAKKLLNAPPAEGAIATYVSDLSQRLRRSAVGGERADEIMQEAEAHLRDHADALRAGGLATTEAESAAVRDFLPAELFARDMARSAFEDGKSSVWYRAGTGAALALLGLTLGLLVTGGMVPFTGGMASAVWVGPFLAVVAFPVSLCVGRCAFAARRAQTRRYLAGGLAAALFAFAYTGFCYVDGAPGEENWTAGSRANIARAYDLWREGDAQLAQNRQFLESGIAVYQSANPVVPQSLRVGDAYRVPRRYRGYDTGKAAPTVATLAEARARWQADGSRWLVRVRQNEGVNAHYREPLRIALTQTGFSWKSAVNYGTLIGQIALWVVLVDFLFSKLGQHACRLRRTKRPQPYAG